MRIGIYKPGKTLYFFKNSHDHASWSPEVLEFAKQFAIQGHSVYILSESDYDNSIENIVSQDLATSPHLDKIFVWNGLFPENLIALMHSLRVRSAEVILCVTDLALLPANIDAFDKVVTQSKQFYTYGALETYPTFNYKIGEYYNKTIDCYFGGTERGRLADIIEYVFRPTCEWYGKSKFFNYLNYIPYDEHIEKLKAAKTTIVIGDEAYNKIGFVTPRYYECIKYDVITFVDMKFDTDELILPKTDWCRVSSYQEMYEKQQILKNNPHFAAHVLQKQRDLLQKVQNEAISVCNRLLA